MIHQALERVVAAVKSLEEPYRSVILERFFHNRSVKEIARQYDVPVATVRTRISRAISKLRERLDREHGGDRTAWSQVLLPSHCRVSPQTMEPSGQSRPLEVSS